MSQGRPPLFREAAIEHYLRNHEKDVLPHLVAPPTFLLGWLLMGILIGATLMAWSTTFPVFATGSGIVLEESTSPITNHHPQHTTLQTLLFFPTTYLHDLHKGEACQAQINETEQFIPCTITNVQSGPLGPGEVQQRFHLSGNTSYIPTRPSIVVKAELEVVPGPDTHHYTGTLLATQVQIRTERILSLVPGLDHVLNGGS